MFIEFAFRLTAGILTCAALGMLSNATAQDREVFSEGFDPQNGVLFEAKCVEGLNKAVSPDGQFRAETGFKTVRIWSVEDNKLLHTFGTTSNNHCPTFTPDSKNIVVATCRGNLGCISAITAFNLETGERKQLGECSGLVLDMAFDSEGRRLAAATYYGSIFSMSLFFEHEKWYGGEIVVIDTQASKPTLRLFCELSGIRGFEPEGTEEDTPPDAADLSERLKKDLASANRNYLPIRVGITHDGTQVIGVTSTGVVRAFDVATGRPQLRLQSQPRAGVEGMLEVATNEESAKPTDGEPEPDQNSAANGVEIDAAIQWIKSVDGRFRRKDEPRESTQGQSPVTYVGLRRGAGSSRNAAPVTDNGLTHLLAFSQLTSLDLGSSVDVTPQGIQQLSKLNHLVDLAYSPLNGDRTQAISHLKNLKRLNLFQGKVSNADLKFLDELSLEKLCLSSTSVSDEGLRRVAAQSNLKLLHIEETGVTDAGMESVASLSSLQNLNLSSTRVTTAGLKKLTPLKNLRVLSLEGLGINDDNVEVLSAFEDLEMLSLHNNPISDRGMKTLKAMNRLRRLSLVGTEVGDEGLLLLAACKQLEMVELYDTKVTSDGIAALQKALPQCVVTRSYSYGGIPNFEITRTKDGFILQAPKDDWP